MEKKVSKAKETTKEKSLEEQLTELKALAAELENPENSLEQSFKLYKEGMNCLAECKKKIDTVEKEFIVLEEG